MALRLTDRFFKLQAQHRHVLRLILQHDCVSALADYGHIVASLLENKGLVTIACLRDRCRIRIANLLNEADVA